MSGKLQRCEVTMSGKPHICGVTILSSKPHRCGVTMSGKPHRLY